MTVFLYCTKPNKETNKISQYDCRYFVRCLSKHKLKYGLPPLVSTAAHSKAVVLLLFVAPIVCGDFVWSLLCCSLHCILSSLAIVSLGKRELILLHLLSSWCHVAASVSWFRGLVSSVWLWHFLDIFTYFLARKTLTWANANRYITCVLILSCG